MKKILIGSAIALLIATAFNVVSCIDKNSSNSRAGGKIPELASMLPRVLFLTTGTAEGNGEIAEGVSIAIQALTQKGAYVWLGTREYLLQPGKMAEFNVIIAPTSFNYHDADRRYSLTFMDDAEMNNIAEWVRNGGIFVAEANIGRNTPAGIDRLSFGGELNGTNWKLSEVFGVRMSELELTGFKMHDKSSGIWSGVMKDTITESEWGLIPFADDTSNLEVLAEWKRDQDVFPGVLGKRYGKGKAYLLTTTYMLHPSNDGGFSGIHEIEKFYEHVLADLNENSKLPIALNPWPGAHSNAACITFNPTGDIAKYEMLVEYLDEQKIPAAFVIDSSASKQTIELLSRNGKHELVSGLASRKDFTGSSMSENSRAFISLEEMTGLKFKGVRFPYRSSNYAGLLYASDNGYVYDASVGIDHLTGYAGSAVPYNIPLSRDSIYKTTEMIELCQVIGNDYDHFVWPDVIEDYSSEIQLSQAQLYAKYLKDFLEYVTIEHNGLMVYSGNPDYIAFSEYTLTALTNLIEQFKISGTWIALPSEVAQFRASLRYLSVHCSENEGVYQLEILCPEGVSYEQLSFRTDRKPKSVKGGANSSVAGSGNTYYIIADVRRGDVIELTF